MSDSLGYAPPAIGYHAPAPIADGTDTWWLPVTYYKNVAPGSYPTGLALAKVSKTADVNALSTKDHLYIPGAAPHVWDGQQLVEQGFLTYPAYTIAVLIAGAGLDIGTYGYLAVYRWTDARGRVHRSHPSWPLSIVTTAGNQQVGIGIPPCHVTRKLGVKIEIYRTKVNGQIYYLLKTLDSDATLHIQSHTDIAGDSTLDGAPCIYNTGEIENIQPPPHKVQCFHHGRQWVVDAEYPDTNLRYSKAQSGESAPQHSDTLIVEVDPLGGPVTALASFMDRVFIFKAGRVLAAYGREASNAGGGTGMYPPTSLSETLGTTDQRSVAVTDVGLFFVSELGIACITKALAVRLIGEQVRYYTDNYAYHKALVVPQLAHVMFFSTSLSAPTLVYNYRYERWSTFSHAGIRDAAVVSGLHHMVNYAGQVSRENRALWADGVYGYELDIDTGWISAAGLLGRTQLNRWVMLGQLIDKTANLVVEVAYNHDPTVIDSQVWTPPAGIDAFDVGEHYGLMGTNREDKSLIVDGQVSRGEITAFRFRFRTYPVGAATEEGWAFSALVMELQKLVGAYFPGTVRQVG